MKGRWVMISLLWLSSSATVATLPSGPKLLAMSISVLRPEETSGMVAMVRSFRYQDFGVLSYRAARRSAGAGACFPVTTVSALIALPAR